VSTGELKLIPAESGVLLIIDGGVMSLGPPLGGILLAQPNSINMQVIETQNC